MAEVASSFVSILPSARGFGSKLNSQIGGDVDASGKKMGGVFGKAMLGVVGGIVAGAAIIGKFTKDAAVLDTKMREVVTLFGETGKAADKSLGVIQTDVKKLSNEFGIAQTTLTGGLYQAISAGVPKENAFTFMQVASKASVAGVTDVETSVNGLTGYINAFGLKTKDATKVADSMFAAVKGGKTTFEEISGSIANVAPAAAAAGVSFQEVNAAIATMTSANVGTSEATTQIRAALVGLQKPSEELNAIFGKVGFSSAQVAIEQKGLGFALDVVKKASGGNNGELQKLLGSSEAVSAANILAGTSAGKFADEMDRQATAAGSVNDAFEVVNAGTQRQFEILKTNLTNVGLSIGQALLPVVNTVLTALNNMGPVISRVSAFLAPFVANIKAMFAGLSGGGASGFMDAIVATFAALAAGRALLPTLQNIGSQIMAVVGPALRDIGNLITTQLLPAFQGMLPVLVPVAKFLIAVIGGAVVGAIKGAVQVIMGVVNVIAGVFRLVTALVQGDWTAAWNAVKQIVSGVINAVVGAIKVWFNLGILAVFKQGLKLLTGTWTAAWNGIKSVSTSATNAIKGVVTSVFNAIKSTVTSVMNGVKSVVTGVWNALKSATTATWNAIKGGVTGVLNAIKSAVTGAMNAVKGAITAAWNAVKGATSSAWNAIKTAVSNGISSVLGLVKSIPGKMTAALGNLGSTLYNAGRDLIAGLIRGVLSKLPDIGGAMSSIGGKIKGFMPGSPVKEGPLTSWNNGAAGKRLIDLLAVGITPDPVTDAMNKALRPASLVSATASTLRAAPRVSYDSVAPGAGEDMGAKLDRVAAILERMPKSYQLGQRQGAF